MAVFGFDAYSPQQIAGQIEAVGVLAAVYHLMFSRALKRGSWNS
ncbi:MAG: hypothetical protein ACREVS_14240 [Burkholderiales bacterium]